MKPLRYYSNPEGLCPTGFQTAVNPVPAGGIYGLASLIGDTFGRSGWWGEALALPAAIRLIRRISTRILTAVTPGSPRSSFLVGAVPGQKGPDLLGAETNHGGQARVYWIITIFRVARSLGVATVAK